MCGTSKETDGLGESAQVRAVQRDEAKLGRFLPELEGRQKVQEQRCL